MEFSDSQENDLMKFLRNISSDCITKMQSEDFDISTMTYIFGAMLTQFWAKTNCDEETMRFNANLMIETVLKAQFNREKESENE